jgi:hypothetical protein
MSRNGFAHLPLHGGKAPPYLFERMVPLAREIVVFIAAEFGPQEVLLRLSDPYWFQAFGCVLGFDWHSRGLTTTVCGALKEGLGGAEKELGIFVAGAAVRSASATLAAAKPEVTLQALRHLPLLELPRRHGVASIDINPKYLEKILLRTYEAAPADFESLLSIQGVGAKTLRALALTSELIYGTRASRKDPARYSFAHGGKDGTPYPVDRAMYDKTIEVMRDALNGAKVDRTEKVRAFRRLAEFAGRQ